MAKMYRKSAKYGGEGGNEWDDGVYGGIRKLYVGQDSSRITYIKFEYVKEDGEVVTSEHGKIDQQPKEFVLEYPDEHIIGVEGYYGTIGILLNTKEMITSLVFKTSKGRKSPTFGPNGYKDSSKKFDFENGGKKIVGFYGRSGDGLDAFGVYFEHDSLTTTTPFSPLLYKLDAQGGEGGRAWDDGSYHGVKKVLVGQDNIRITYLEFEYEKEGKTEIQRHGVKKNNTSEFVLDYPNEYIKSVEATYNKPPFYNNTVIVTLSFKTSKDRTSTFGQNRTGKKFSLEQKDLKLVGFHGREGSAIDALGAYFGPISTVVPAKKLPALGGEGGSPWDDGVYDGVRKILVGQGNYGVSFVKFEYIKGTSVLPGADHGEKTLLDPEEFVLEDDEYLTGLEGYYDKVYGVEAPLIISLKFKTNKRESYPFGMTSGEKFTLGENGQKIVGFHGQASDVVHSIGVTLVPIATTK